MRVDLEGREWLVQAAGALDGVPPDIARRRFPTALPACAYGVLVDAGAVGHPDEGMSERENLWIGRTDWRFTLSTSLPAEVLGRDQCDLVLDGLDTAATICVGGTELARAANAHHAHRFDLRPVLHGSPALDLQIDFTAPQTVVQAEEARLGARPINGGWGPYVFLRKAACNFGWDWGPRLSSSGIRRAARIEAWSIARLDAVCPVVESAADDMAHLRVGVRVQRSDASVTPVLRVTGTLTAPDGRVFKCERVLPAGASRADLAFCIDHPQRWWPRGYGDPSLHDLRVALHEGDCPLDVCEHHVGLREVRLLRDADASGSSFAFAVNGRRIMALGANWIPRDLFAAAGEAQRDAELVSRAADTGFNMLRVWGGGVYASEGFYQACDRAGIMVWQDFMFACGLYPEEAPFPALIEREARAQVERLVAHPCIVLWCGGNENELAYDSWGWKERCMPGLTRGTRYWHEILPRVVREIDPSAPYWADSPWSGSPAVRPNDPDHGDRHTWDLKVDAYRSITPRFLSEFGHQSPPNLATLGRVLPAVERRVDSPLMEHRQRAWGGSVAQYSILEEWFGPAGCVDHARRSAATTFESWHYLAQLLQARACAIAYEWNRAHRDRCGGVLVWQLNDCWTGYSWSLIDVDGRRKPAWYAVRRACAARAISLHPGSGGNSSRTLLMAVNDGPETWRGAIRVARMDVDGAVRAQQHWPLTLEPGSTGVAPSVESMVGALADPAREFFVAEDAGDPERRAVHFAVRDVHVAWPVPRLTAHADGHGRLHIHAHTLLRDLWIDTSGSGACADADEQLLTLLPGESATITFEECSSASLARAVARTVGGVLSEARG